MVTRWVFGSLCIAVFLAWSAVNKKSEENNYGKGSTDASTTITRNPLSIDLFDLHCDYIKPDAAGKTRNQEVKK